MIVYIVYALASTYPQVAASLLCLYISFVVVIGVRWKKLTIFFRALSLFFVSIPIIFVGLIYIAIWLEHSSDTIRRSDYKGGCKVEELINGDCIFDSIRWEHANFYPIVTEDDGVWERLEGYDKTELLKTAEKELAKLRSGKYKGQEEQITRVQSFIDILQRRYGVGTWKEEAKEERSPQEVVDATSLKLYGSRIGMQGTVSIDTINWEIENNKKVTFSFKYPKGAKVLSEGNCYRVEYGEGFVIFLLPMEGDARCGARTGVGALPDNTDVTDRLTIQGKEYLAPGFQAVMDTKGEMFYKPETRYFYDFHHLLSMEGDGSNNCLEDCIKIGYGIYKEVSTPLSKVEVDRTMDSLRAIVESVRYEK